MAMCWLGAVPQSEIRVRFGLRLKGFRQSAGYSTARAFAEALELDENRYTRYERGEVEPNLAIVCKMCSTLGVEPNDLLGFDRARSQLSTSAGQGARVDGSANGEPGPSQAWQLASAVATLERKCGGCSTSSDPGPLAALRATIEIYRRLLTHDRGRVIGEILNAAALDGMEPARQADLASLIDAFMRETATPGAI